MTSHEQDAETYRLRAKGMDWPDIARQLGIDAEGAKEAASRHAQETGKRWPPLYNRLTPPPQPECGP